MSASPEVLARLACSPTLLLWWCPGCSCPHQLETRPGAFVWDGDLVRPTVAPSLLIRHADLLGQRLCHVEIREGVLRYRIASTHAHAGMAVPMVAWAEAIRAGY